MPGRLPPDFDRQAEQPDEPQAAIAAADLQSVLPRLSESSRTVLTLHYLEGFDLAGVKLFQADQTRDQILYATGFLTFVHLLALMKIFAWQMLHRNSLAREIKRLEIRIAELAKSLDKPAPGGSH